MLPPHRSGYNDEAVRYEVPMILKLLPRLRLDTLTIIADAEPEFAYFTLEMFLSKGHGWKTLRFITPMSSILAFNTLRPPPHVLSDETRELRLSFYRSTCPGVPGSVLDPACRELSGQSAPCPELLEKFGTTENEGLLADDERLRETLTIVKRGRSADISDVGGPPYRSEDPRKWGAHDIAWKYIRKGFINSMYIWTHGLKFASLILNGEGEPEHDVYNDPDEYGEPRSPIR
ncbi:hypothetical protein PAAG_08033 [Paracoccidioides lutzii Pb01]|uniref:Uncharacterized protein n=1 Tax=Paracoccidioides lutzii (strain ATCC MYA-826 / Pb01) TaxID=502779 RepID=C1HB92_PARBA|nr:hypothetical protein PAAG_08033 [Paracoccidioides lutzii Pb01]EEH37615.2 hypothetical protein PAAG_08033 [Paracoccidioides lutzii Pb01]